ncbi:MAG TPA: SCO family protein [Steroidobacteraceae bacterium]|nr:SCO family protein [Steroidobacteraceae bacterium]
MKRWWLLLTLAAAFAAHAGNAPADVGWTQRIGAPLPLDLAFDENGRRVMLRDYFHDVPVIIVFAYLSCSRLCPETLAGVREALHGTGLAAGRDYELLVLSIDPGDDHRASRWGGHLLTSTDGAVSQVTAAAGFRYVRTGEPSQFGHAAGFLVATPQGAISRYFFGVRYPADDVGAALLAARGNGIGSLTERLLLLCSALGATHSDRSESIMIGLRVLAVCALLAVATLGWRSFVGKGRLP